MASLIRFLDAVSEYQKAKEEGGDDLRVNKAVNKAQDALNLYIKDRVDAEVASAWNQRAR